ncbi:arsenate reductase (glutaredoxin) [Flavobacterium agricola]|uniref:Arsenate reductase (Glutaredoxin) n=1 Tax=Flavobacterium agricola TaxID=2870839 RepID=A0ABY6M0C3_9FLAO|nr:arsenate reductase (glutaredoxin) [Flavobacterium agricola]UYW01934.1 arsenate reductase (glutaredoxin) [Flavobacterium agricola]
MLKIYHNPRCSKSRDGICFLDELQVPYEVVKYLDEPLDEKELKEIIKKLNIKPIELVRIKEKIWIENYKNQNLTDAEIITALAENPKLIERPIVINQNKAIIARPTKKIKEIL